MFGIKKYLSRCRATMKTFGLIHGKHLLSRYSANAVMQSCGGQICVAESISQPSHFPQTFFQHFVATRKSFGHQGRQVKVNGLAQPKQQVDRLNGRGFELSCLKLGHLPNQEQAAGMSNVHGYYSSRLILRITVRFFAPPLAESFGNGSCAEPSLDACNCPGENNAKDRIKSTVVAARFKPVE